MTLDIHQQKANTRSEAFFLKPKIYTKMSQRTKNVKNLVFFLHALKRQILSNLFGQTT